MRNLEIQICLLWMKWKRSIEEKGANITEDSAEPISTLNSSELLTKEFQMYGLLCTSISVKDAKVDELSGLISPELFKVVNRFHISQGANIGGDRLELTLKGVDMENQNSITIYIAQVRKEQ